MDDVELRPAGPDDAGAIADVYLASFQATYDFPLAHSDEQVRQWIRDLVLPTQEVWVAATSDGVVVGLMALTPDTLDQLYVAPGWTGHGIGSRLLRAREGQSAERARPVHVPGQCGCPPVL